MWLTSQLAIIVTTKVVVIYSYTCKFPLLNQYSINGGCGFIHKLQLASKGKSCLITILMTACNLLAILYHKAYIL